MSHYPINTELTNLCLQGASSELNSKNRKKANPISPK